MTRLVALVRLLPLAFLGRLGIAFVEIVLASVVLSGSVVLGHDLRAWRAWYWDPSTLRYWNPTPSPTVTQPAAAAPQPMPIAVSSSVPTLAPAPAPVCVTDQGSMLVFSRPWPSGVDCVWLSRSTDGWHVDVATSGTRTDLGMISLSIPRFDVYAPTSAADPICVVVGDVGSQWANGMVFALQRRGPLLLLSTGGRSLSVHAGSDGWPWVQAVRSDSGVDRMHQYYWSGTGYAER